MKRSEVDLDYLEEWDKHHDDHIVICPYCGSNSTFLTGFEASCRIPIYPDGWDFTEGGIDTGEEQFVCSNCDKAIPGEFVFGTVTWDPEEVPTP